MQILTGSFILTTFSLPQIHQNQQQQQNWSIFKFAFSSERCRKKQFWHSHAARQSFFFLIRMQRGNAISNFFNTSPARMRFLSFCQHVPSEKLRNDEHAVFESLLRRHVAKGAERKSSQKPTPAMEGNLWHENCVMQKATNSFRNHLFFQWIWTILINCVMPKYMNSFKNCSFSSRIVTILHEMCFSWFATLR